MKPLLTSALLIFAAALFSQTVIDSQNLVFHSDLEKQAFAEKEGSKINPQNVVALFLSINLLYDKDDLAEVQQEIQDVIHLIEAQGIAGKKYKKSSKIIFNTVHDRLLRQYKLDAQFGDLFDKGIYNCATASALYAIILEHFHLPYAIVETPNHINILLDPGGENIVMESTNPVQGLYKLDKQKVVESLVSMKLVPESYIIGKSAEQVYDEYFQETKRNIDLYQLAGDLYNNAAIRAINEDRYPVALNLIEKSLYLNPSKLCDHTRLFILAQLVDAATDDKPENFKIHFSLLAYESMRERVEEIIEWRYFLVSDKLLLETYKPEEYAKFHDYFLKNLTDKPALLKKIELVHHYQIGRTLALRNNYEASIHHLDSAYMLDTGNVKLQLTLTTIVNASLVGLLKNQREKLKEELDVYSTKYPFIVNAPQICQLRCMYTAMNVFEFFDKKDIEEGFKAFPAFEQSLSQLTERPPHVEDVIGVVYSTIAGHYMYRGDYEQAEEWLKKGFATVPNDPDLKQIREELDAHYQRLGKPERTKN